MNKNHYSSEEPGKTGAPCVKVPGSSRVPGWSSAVMARRRRRRPHGGQTTEAGSGRRRDPFSTDTASHTHTARSLACPLLTLFSSARSFSNGIFRSDGAPCARPLLPSSDRSAGQSNQPSHSTVLARPVCLFVCVGADERVSRGQASERAVCVCEAVSVEKGSRRLPLPASVVCPP